MDYQSLVESKINPVSQAGDEIIYSCPVCEDPATGHHLYVNYRKGYWHCFKCSSGGRRLESLLVVLGISLDSEELDFQVDLKDPYDDQLDVILQMKEKPIGQIHEEPKHEYSYDLDILTQYYEAHTKPLTQASYYYLLSRGLNSDQIERLQIREGKDCSRENFLFNGQSYSGKDYSNRVLVPSLHENGQISFYVARDYTGFKLAKYLNPPKSLAKASEDCWNLAQVKSNSCIVCEGVFTAIAASPCKGNAVATYGKSISEGSTQGYQSQFSQGEKLIKRHFQNYYLAYDADAHAEAFKAADYLYNRGAKVFIILIDPAIYGPKADVADIGYERFLELLAKAIPYNGLTSKLDWLIIE